MMHSDGTYARGEGGAGTSSQEALYRYFSTRKVSLNAPGPEKKPEERKKQAESKEPAQKSTFREWFRKLLE